jgi:FkbM family methyltransferase
MLLQRFSNRKESVSPTRPDAEEGPRTRIGDRYFVRYGIFIFLVFMLLTSWRSTTFEGSTRTPTTTITDAAHPSAAEIWSFTLNMDAQMTQLHSARSRTYGNKADFEGNKRLLSFIKDLGLDRKESVVLIGGVNDGQSSVNTLEECPSLSLYGFEIQIKHFENTKRKFTEKGFRSATVVNLGWSDKYAEKVPIGGNGEGGGLFNPKGQRNWKLQDNTATTVRLDEWTSANSIDSVLYVIIDTEGHEPKVIRGMGLEKVENQRKFALFQYELGGTWAERDNRHGSDKWNQYLTARHLEGYGYRLFHIGSTDWLAVNANYFIETNNPAMRNEGFGPFIQGNVLAMHMRYTPSNLAVKILQNVTIFKK